MKITTIGLNVAKKVSHVVCFDERFKERGKKMLRLHQSLKKLRQHTRLLRCYESLLQFKLLGAGAAQPGA